MTWNGRRWINGDGVASCCTGLLNRSYTHWPVLCRIRPKTYTFKISFLGVSRKWASQRNTKTLKKNLMIVDVVVGLTLGFVVSVRKGHGLFLAVNIYGKIPKKQIKNIRKRNVFLKTNYGNNISIKNLAFLFSSSRNWETESTQDLWFEGGSMNW